MASCSDDRKVRIWRYANSALNGNDAANPNPFTTSKTKESPASERYAERYYCDSNMQENISPEKTNPTKTFFSTPASSKKRPRRISDYFSAQNEI